MKKIYLAAGLFNAGERLHNLFLEKHLKNFGYNVILPQREALKFFNGENFDIQGIVSDCLKSCSENETICIANIDGSDADSGTAVEYGFALAKTGRAIVYRTDFRTYLEKELGVNAMLTAPGTHLIYEPCYFTELEQVDEYYQTLAQKIDTAIKTLENEGPHIRVRFNFPEQQKGDHAYFFLEHNLDGRKTEKILNIIENWRNTKIEKIGYQTKVTISMVSLRSFLRNFSKNTSEIRGSGHFTILNSKNSPHIEKIVAEYWDNNLNDS